MKPESGEKGQGEEEEIPIGNISETVFHRGSVPGIFSVFAVERRVCMSQCGYRHAYRLSNGRYQCVHCHHQVCVTAGTALHKTHMPLTQWFLAFYLCAKISGDLHSAVVLAAWNDLQDGLVYAQAHPFGHGSAGRKAPTQRNHRI